MVVQSMTGYGRGEHSPYRVEIRGTNQRHLDIQVKAGAGFLAFEPKIRELLRKAFHRGRLEVYVRVMGGRGTRVCVDTDAAESVVASLRSLKDRLKLTGDVDVATIGGIREIYETEEEEADVNAFWQALELGIASLARMREREGKALAEDILQRIDRIETCVRRIEQRAEGIIERMRETLKGRMEELFRDAGLDENRLAQELVYYTDRADITEELVRVGSHIEQFRSTLGGGGVIGKKLDFLSQEILRETNTIGAKAADSEVARHVIVVKTELEKIREQLQNIE